VEFAKGEIATLFFAHVFAKFEDLQLSECVVKVGGVGSAALGFDVGDARRLKTFLDEKFARLIERVFKGTLAEAIDPAKPKPDLILWSESPAPFFFESDPGFTDSARRLARATRTPFLFGAVAYSPQQDQLNAAIMLNPAGEEISRYAKMYLVPFGEFVPPIFFWVNKITKEVGTSVPGTRILVPPVDGHGVGGFICYESAFPELVS